MTKTCGAGGCFQAPESSSLRGRPLKDIHISNAGRSNLKSYNRSTVKKLTGILFHHTDFDPSLKLNRSFYTNPTFFLRASKQFSYSFEYLISQI